MPRRRTSRVYWRQGRAWADFRDYADVGGRQEPLKAKGSRFATKDADEAARLADARLRHYEALRRTAAVQGLTAGPETFEALVERYLKERAESGEVKRSTLLSEEYQLRLALEVLPADTYVHDLTVKEAKALVRDLRKRKSKKGGTLSPLVVRQAVDAVARAYARAMQDGTAPFGANPFTLAGRPKKTTGREAEWLEPPEVGALLRAAVEVYGLDAPETAILFTFAYTGGRKLEVLGLEVSDVNFAGKRIYVRPNEARDTKRSRSRSLKLWPDHEEVLRAYLRANPRIGGLLFPSRSPLARRGLRTNFDLTLREIVKKAKLKKKVTHHTLRHSFTAARLQMLDNGEPIAVFTVARELGHEGTKLIDAIYGHLGELRERSETLSYPWRETPSEAQTDGGFVTAIVTSQ